MYTSPLPSYTVVLSFPRCCITLRPFPTARCLYNSMILQRSMDIHHAERFLNRIPARYRALGPDPAVELPTKPPGKLARQPCRFSFVKTDNGKLRGTNLSPACSVHELSGDTYEKSLTNENSRTLYNAIKTVLGNIWSVR